MKIMAFSIVLFYTLLTISCLAPMNGSFTQKDSGITFSSSRGGTIEISLNGNPTTGYTWNIVEYNKKVLKLEGSTFIQDSNLAGAGGVETFRFLIIEKGETNLLLQYNRIWEKDVKPAKSFKLEIISK